ncbi:RidA family protein [Vibrio mediterranei]|uniref:RidA family protein n=1 Tax=Vibrio mediterranei TaxID=689 RepID=UPI001EFD0992|nr:RidA family protein [Vibrio mediterranei]MCG9661266.1 RidA family protein [Vibrio mediterranei]
MQLSASNQYPEERLHLLKIELPKAPKAVSNYEPIVQTGNLIMTSGQLPWIEGRLMYEGQLGHGGELTDEQGYSSCRLSALNAIAQLKEHLGDLNRVKRIVRIVGVLNVNPMSRWTEQPKVLDGASDIINDVFGERGRHSRMISSNSCMPLDCTSLIYLYAEVE